MDVVASQGLQAVAVGLRHCQHGIGIDNQGFVSAQFCRFQHKVGLSEEVMFGCGEK